jgi:hypothetical protein
MPKTPFERMEGKRMRPQHKSRGRSGGRAGGAGYDFQDIYVAWQLAKLLVGERDPVVEVLWEKKAIDHGAKRGSEVHVDDAIIRLRSGTCIYTQLKETAPGGIWSLRDLIRSGVVEQFWRQWQSSRGETPYKVILRFASGGIVAPLAVVIDAASRSNTPAELMEGETSGQAATDAEVLAMALGIGVDDPLLLEFLKGVRAEQLPGSEELQHWIAASLAPFGPLATDMADRLIRIVARSKHIGPQSRAAHTRETLLEQLQTEGLPTQALIAAGLIPVGKRRNPAFWRNYRATVVKAFRNFRVYGLEVERAVFADLPSLFVPLKLLPLKGEKEQEAATASESERRRSFAETLSGELSSRSESRDEPVGATDLKSVLANTRRFALLGGQGCGKTTTLRWLAVIAALEDEEGTRTRERFGLPREPQLPLFVRFRRLAERIRARGLEGVAGRVGLVAEFLAAEFEAGIAGRVLSKDEALEVAHELLLSENTLLLFDALDEVPDDTMRKGLVEAVADLIREYPAPRIVMSSRPYAFGQERLQIELPRFAPLPLDRAARETFAQQWYRSVRSHLGDALSEADAMQRGDDLAREAERVPDLAETPLLLSILALVHFNRQGLQGQRARLYDHATLAMLGHWERDVAGRNLGDDTIPSDWAPRLKLQEDEIRRVVERLARDVQVGEAGSEFTTEAAIESLACGLESISGSPEGARDRGQLLLRLLVERSGLLQERSSGTYGFVHLSFQEYFSARWFVGCGEKALIELAILAKDDRHAEVVRFSAGILIADQRVEADERARKLILSVAENNGVLAAACLLDAPRLEVLETDSEELARAAWAEEWHYLHHRPDVMSRLIWGLLERTARADQVLLELLAQGNDQHGRMEFETSYALLASRPPRPMTPEFRWFARRLANSPVEHGPPISSICELLLVEAGEDAAEKHVAGLVALVRESGWLHRMGDTRGTLAERAERVLRDVFADEAKAPTARAILSAVLRASDSRRAVAAGRFLLSLAEPLTVDFAEVLVSAGIKECRWDSDLCSWFAKLASDPTSRELIAPRLTNALTDDDKEIRLAAARVLKEAGVTASEVLDLRTDERDSTRTEVLTALLADPSKSEEIATRLADDLWADTEEDSDRVWEATVALLLAGRPYAPGVPQALVRVGLSSAGRRHTATEQLRKLRTDPKMDLAVRAALLDGLGSENSGVASVCSMILVDMEDAVGKGRVKRITEALLGDVKQMGDALPRLKHLLKGDDSEAAFKAIGDYLKTHSEGAVAAASARLLADAGRSDVPHVAVGLAVSGLSDAWNSDEMLAHLRGMLENPRLVADTRRVLSEALEDSDSRVAWGAVQLLWEVGAHFDPRLASALVRAGLQSEGRRPQARKWLLELLQQPGTSVSTGAALHGCLRDLLSRSKPEYEQAWPVAQCLLQAGVVDSEYLPKELVFGGLGDSRRHDEVLTIVSSTVSQCPGLGKGIEKEAWAAVSQEFPEHGIPTVPWGAVRLLTTSYATSVADVMAGRGDEERRLALLRVLLRVSEHNPMAHSILAQLMSTPGAGQLIQGALVRLLSDPDRAAAFGAALVLAESDDVEHFSLPSAVIEGGLGNGTSHGKAEKLLDDIGTRPSMKFAMRSALCAALWGKDPEVACNAAVYVMDRGRATDQGVARGLVYGTSQFHHRWGGKTHAKALRRVRTLLLNPRTRDAAMDALGANLYEHENERSSKDSKGRTLNFETVALLATCGIDLSEVFALTSEERLSWFAPQILALVALSGRVDESRNAAKRLGVAKLLDLLGS